MSVIRMAVRRQTHDYQYMKVINCVLSQDRRSDVALAMCHKQHCYHHLPARTETSTPIRCFKVY